MNKILELNIPIRLFSEANIGFSLRSPKMTWIRMKKRKEAQKNAIYNHWMLSTKNVPLPCHVKLTRIAPRKLDKEDNLPFAFKYAKDILADLLRPGLAPGRADDTDQITWEYDQKKGEPKQYGIKIEIYS